MKTTTVKEKIVEALLAHLLTDTTTAQPAGEDLFFRPGKTYFLRTVTHHHVGTLVRCNDRELVLEKAAWIPDDGRFAQAVAKADFKEVEPFPEGSEILLNRGSLVDAVEITGSVNLSQK